MAIDKESGKRKHVITEYNNWVDYGGGRGGLHAYTFCGWLYVGDQMEGGHIYGEWWANPAVPDVCPLCVHRLECKAETDEEKAGCEGCRMIEADHTRGHPLKREEVSPDQLSLL